MIEMFYAADARPDSKRIVLRGGEARHIVRVLRHRVGDAVLVTNGRGDEFEVRLEVVLPYRVEGRVIRRNWKSREPSKRLVLAQALLKGPAMVKMVETVTEIGVSEIVPILTARVVARPLPTKLARLEHLAVEGLKVSGRTVLPKIGGLIGLEGLTGRFGEFDQVLVAYEQENRRGIGDVLERGAESVLLVIGPEGGFTDAEIAMLARAGAKSFSLGPRRLRAETAAVVGTALCLQAMGELGTDGHLRSDGEVGKQSERRC